MPRKGEFRVNHQEIVRLYKEGVKPAEIAARMGTALSNIYRHISMADAAPTAASVEEASTPVTVPPITVRHEPSKGVAAAADGTCEKCSHHAVCRLLDDRRRAYEALSRAVSSLPRGLRAEYKVPCEHYEKTPEERGAH